MSVIRDLDSEALKALPLPANDQETDKDARGRVLLIGGSATSPGAVLLSGVASLRAGAGKVLVATAQMIATQIGLVAPEFGVAALPATSTGEPDGSNDSVDRHLDQCDAVLLGPGMMDANNARHLALRVLAKIEVPVVLDAAAIGAFSGDFDTLRRFNVTRILTPHAGEMAALMGVSKERVQKAPIEVVGRAAQELESTIVLKGPSTYIATLDGTIWHHAGGVCGLATAGSGDTLAGLLVGLLARGASAVSASAWSVLAHAKAGMLLTEAVGPTGFLARELPATFPKILRDLARSVTPDV